MAAEFVRFKYRIYHHRCAYLYNGKVRDQGRKREAHQHSDALAGLFHTYLSLVNEFTRDFIKDTYWSVGNHLPSVGLREATPSRSDSQVTQAARRWYTLYMPSAHPGGTTPTAYQFTSQRNETALGLYFYNARWYDPALSRFTSADTLVPGGVQGYDRYAYTINNPVRYTDPSGHRCVPEDECEHPSGDMASSNNGNGNQSQETIITGPIGPIITTHSPQSGPEDEFEAIGIFAKYGKYAIDIFTWIGNYGQPIYKQAKGLGNAGPIIEGFAGALLQAAQDWDDPSFSNFEKISRAAIAGGEDAVTDMISAPVAVFTAGAGADLGAETGVLTGGLPGGLAGGLLGGTAGYVGGNYVATQAMDRIVWPIFNSVFFPNLFP